MMGGGKWGLGQSFELVWGRRDFYEYVAAPSTAPPLRVDKIRGSRQAADRKRVFMRANPRFRNGQQDLTRR